MTSLSPQARHGHLLRLIRRRLGPKVVRDEASSATEDRATVDKESLLSLLRFLRDDPDADLDLLVDLTAIDHLNPDGISADPRGRFEVLYHLRNPRLQYRMWLSTFLDGEDPTVPSVVGLFPAADWHEREIWDLFGIYADGHPYLRHLLLYSGFSGHPMRSDYPARKAQPLVAMRMRSRAPVVVRSETKQTAEAAALDDKGAPSARSEGDSVVPPSEPPR